MADKDAEIRRLEAEVVRLERLLHEGVKPVYQMEVRS